MTPDGGRMPARPGTAGAAAQDINPDRPDLTTSAEVVPAGVLQVETGLEYERARVGGGPTERQLSVQGVLRLGLTPAPDWSAFIGLCVRLGR